jgi:hypothetical protein
MAYLQCQHPTQQDGLSPVRQHSTQQDVFFNFFMITTRWLISSANIQQNKMAYFQCQHPTQQEHTCTGVCDGGVLQ